MGEGKLTSLTRAAGLVADGDHITIGGVMLHRIPAAFVREVARQRRRNLRLSKPSPSYGLDLLCAAGCLAEVDAGVASLESAFGGALPNYRRAVEDLESLSPPTPAELATLEALDPDRLRDLDFR